MGFWLSKLVYVCMFIWIAAGWSQVAWGSAESKRVLYASTYHLYEFTNRIAVDRFEVRSVLPPGADSHDYEPSARQMMEIARADGFIYNGAGLELWIEKLLRALDSDHQLLLVETTRGLDFLKVDDDHHHHEHGPLDPHVWLDPTLAKQQARVVADALISLDPAGQAIYEHNFQKLAGELLALDQRYTREFSKLTRRQFVVPHQAFFYLARRYNLEQIAIAGVHPGSEPTQREVMAIIDFLRASQQKYIFFETTVSNRIAQAIASEVGAKTLVLNPVENLTSAQRAAGETYFSIMQQNLQNLITALK